jgi:hypothetical protein
VIHLFQDFLDAPGPDKRLGVLIVGFHVTLDGFDQFLHAFDDAAANPFPGDFTKPPLHQIQPGRTGGNEMLVESFVSLNPVFDLRVLVRGMVVHDQIQVHSWRSIPVPLPEKLEKLLVPGALKAGV